MPYAGIVVSIPGLRQRVLVCLVLVRSVLLAVRLSVDVGVELCEKGSPVRHIERHATVWCDRVHPRAPVKDNSEGAHTPYGHPTLHKARDSQADRWLEGRR